MFIEPFLIFFSTLISLNTPKQDVIDQSHRPEPKHEEIKPSVRIQHESRGGWDYN